MTTSYYVECDELSESLDEFCSRMGMCIRMHTYTYTGLLQAVLMASATVCHRGPVRRTRKGAISGLERSLKRAAKGLLSEDYDFER